MEGWTCIYTTTQEYEAELLKGMLEEHLITVILVNKRLSVYNIGEVELYVPVDDALRAIQLVKNPDRE